ncbi:hypothetical protein [Bradyrhizobium sp. CCGUVB23]|nr:hypothetical protein [Bradyrhizobium sp. CCGUVB23]MCP3459604.1 hypothetical protein [Bradyrhizobium sp. CCGUVB23]
MTERENSPAYAALNLRQPAGAEADEAAEAHDGHSTTRAAADRLRPWK